MNSDLQIERAKAILTGWMKVKSGEQVLIVTDELHLEEALNIRQACGEIGAAGVLLAVDSTLAMEGRMGKIVDGAAACADVIIGATHISIATTTVKIVGEANGARMVSLPMAVNNNISILEADFTGQDIGEAKALSEKLAGYLTGAAGIRVTTDLGTDLSFATAGRPVFSTEEADAPGKFISASFEIAVAPIEEHTQGIAILDGSMGYLGLVGEPVELLIEGGKIVKIATTPSGMQLKEYLDSFRDPGMYGVAEFGIGLNKKAKCAGDSYVEDESAYGTFHLGFGRNMAIGGQQEAVAHFDLVFHRPTIHVDGVIVVENGEICG